MTVFCPYQRTNVLNYECEVWDSSDLVHVAPFIFYLDCQFEMLTILVPY